MPPRPNSASGFDSQQSSWGVLPELRELGRGLEDARPITSPEFFADLFRELRIGFGEFPDGGRSAVSTHGQKLLCHIRVGNVVLVLKCGWSWNPSPSIQTRPRIRSLKARSQAKARRPNGGSRLGIQTNSTCYHSLPSLRTGEK